jgi:hypothetical protein
LRLDAKIQGPGRGRDDADVSTPAVSLGRKLSHLTVVEGWGCHPRRGQSSAGEAAQRPARLLRRQGGWPRACGFQTLS